MFEGYKLKSEKKKYKQNIPTYWDKDNQEKYILKELRTLQICSSPRLRELANKWRSYELGPPLNTEDQPIASSNLSKKKKEPITNKQKKNTFKTKHKATCCNKIRNLLKTKQINYIKIPNLIPNLHTTPWKVQFFKNYLIKRIFRRTITNRKTTS